MIYIYIQFVSLSFLLYSALAVDVKVGRMICYGFLFKGYLAHTIVMVASLSSSSVFLKPIPFSIAKSIEVTIRHLLTMDELTHSCIWTGLIGIHQSYRERSKV